LSKQQQQQQRLHSRSCFYTKKKQRIEFCRKDLREREREIKFSRSLFIQRKTRKKELGFVDDEI